VKSNVWEKLPSTTLVSSKVGQKLHYPTFNAEMPAENSIEMPSVVLEMKHRKWQTKRQTLPSHNAFILWASCEERLKKQLAATRTKSSRATFHRGHQLLHSDIIKKNQTYLPKSHFHGGSVSFKNTTTECSDCPDEELQGAWRNWIYFCKIRLSVVRTMRREEAENLLLTKRWSLV